MALFGHNDGNLASIERNFGITLVARGDTLLLDGPAESIRHASGLLRYMIESIRRNPEFGEDEVKAILEQDRRSGLPDTDTDAGADEPSIRTYRSTVKPRGHGQSAYLRAIENHDIVFAIGPAGTGKTYLAVADGSAV